MYLIEYNEQSAVVDINKVQGNMLTCEKYDEEIITYVVVKGLASIKGSTEICC